MSALERVTRAGLASDAPSPLQLGGLAWSLLAATEAAAAAAQPWVGRGDPKAADRAAVAAMRVALGRVGGRGVVVVGEGEKDAAPMLFAGEEVGTGEGPSFEIAADPLDGTTYCAEGRPGAIAILAASGPGGLWSTPGYYADKLVVPEQAGGMVELGAPIEDNLLALARALGKPAELLEVAILAKPRHEGLIRRARALGVRVHAMPDGDVLAALRVLLPGGDLDGVFGVGGAPEGVLSACATKVLSGTFLFRHAPASDAEAAMLERLPPAERFATLGTDDLVRGPAVVAASGVTVSELLDRPRATSAGVEVSSLVLVDGRAGFVRRVLPTA